MLRSQTRQQSELYRRARATLDRLRGQLLGHRNEVGHWVGRLSPSALSTATAISAMSATLIDGGGTGPERETWMRCIDQGIAYLRGQQNVDGGFGDTDRSYSNIATSYLALAASQLAAQATGRSLEVERVSALRDYLREAGELDGLRRRYGTDKTFVVPILTNLAIAGLVDWDDVPALPFEAAIFPQSMYRWLQMPVVSYAIPALVAIGQARYFHGRRAMLPLRLLRFASIGRTMNVLRRMQPDSGGYLEATPLTSFVVMSLAATGRSGHDVSKRGLRFLVESMDGDGSWPIDTNLATWVTSLSIHALTRDPEDDGRWCSESLVRWHLNCQHTRRHPFTGAPPGGWGWTDLSGAVPDGDDTPAALIAHREIMKHTTGGLREESRRAIDGGQRWLDQLQNRDGGWPTFCRGWGKLPFDRSSNDSTAHAIRALHDHPSVSKRSLDRGVKFLHRNQRADGSWLPLWFGNQDMPDEINPVYGTSRVLVASTTGLLDPGAVARGCEYLIGVQNEDGGWGGGPGVTGWLRSTSASAEDDDDDRGTSDPAGVASTQATSSIEETALAIDGLVSVLLRRSLTDSRNIHGLDGVPSPDVSTQPVRKPRESDANDSTGEISGHHQAIIRGIEFLIGAVENDRHRVAWPIGFYFAKLWYHEELYPLIFATTAIGNYMRAAGELSHDDL